MSVFEIVQRMAFFIKNIQVLKTQKLNTFVAVWSYFENPALKRFSSLKMGSFLFGQNCSILEKLVNESHFEKPRDVLACVEYLQVRWIKNCCFVNVKHK